MKNQYFVREIPNKEFRKLFKKLQRRAIEEKSGWKLFKSKYHKAVLLCIGSKTSSWKPIGYLMWSGKRSSVIIRQIWIAPEYRRKGAGLFLMKEWYADIMAKKRRKLILESPEIPLLNLLSKEGYDLDETNIIHYGY